MDCLTPFSFWSLGSRCLFNPPLEGESAGALMAVYHAPRAFASSFSEGDRKRAQGFRRPVTALCPDPTDTEFQKVAGMITRVVTMYLLFAA